MISAMGTDAPTVNTPHALSARAPTTTLPRPASAMMVMAKHGDHGEQADPRPELVSRDLRERTPAAPHAGHEQHEVVHAAGEHHAEEDPQVARQEPELRREHRADQRAGARDGGEVVPEQDVRGWSGESSVRLRECARACAARRRERALSRRETPSSTGTRWRAPRARRGARRPHGACSASVSSSIGAVCGAKASPRRLRRASSSWPVSFQTWSAVGLGPSR